MNPMWNTYLHCLKKAQHCPPASCRNHLWRIQVSQSFFRPFRRDPLAESLCEVLVGLLNLLLTCSLNQLCSNLTIIGLALRADLTSLLLFLPTREHHPSSTVHQFCLNQNHTTHTLPVDAHHPLDLGRHREDPLIWGGRHHWRSLNLPTLMELRDPAHLHLGTVGVQEDHFLQHRCFLDQAQVLEIRCSQTRRLSRFLSMGMTETTMFLLQRVTSASQVSELENHT